MLGLYCSAGFFFSCDEQVLLSSCRGIPIGVASLVAKHGPWGTQASGVVAVLWSVGSIAVVPGLSRFAACGIFLYPDEPMFLHWQVDSLLLSHQGSPRVTFEYMCVFK